MKINVEIPDGILCNTCLYLQKSDIRESGTNRCLLFGCTLGNKLTDILKCPHCIQAADEVRKANEKKSNDAKPHWR